MEEAPGLSDQYRMASPWPVFVALGLPISEIGILFGVFPVAVGGLLLFAGSIAGMLGESGYAATPWRALAVIGGILLIAGVALVALEVDPMTHWYAIVVGDVSVFAASGLVSRGYAVITAAVLLFAAALLGEFVVRDARSSV